jgi:hypothetical protein
MNRAYLLRFARQCLSKYGTVTPSLLQDFIHNHPSSGSIIDPEELGEMLDFLVSTGYLELIDGSIDRECVYQRFII